MAVGLRSILINHQFLKKYMENIKLHLTQLTFVVLVWLFCLYCYTKVDSLNRKVTTIHGREKAQESLKRWIDRAQQSDQITQHLNVIKSKTCENSK